MKEYKCILSEKPDALDGALEWIDEEIAKEKALRNDKNRITQKLKDEVRPLVIKIAQSRGITPIS
ncbi:MAG: hypothetical protein IJR29_04385 [Butyrivibrio sp.]|nr:hypothetical protein [Butyrivibrio sp.]